MQLKEKLVTKASYSNEWLWSTWLMWRQPPRLKYEQFIHMEFFENETNRLQIESALAKLLYEYHTQLPVDTNLLAHLKYRQLASVLSDSFDQRPRDRFTRLGNFIEILACELAKKLEYDIPVFRLQYNPNRDQSMKGDDILGFRSIDDESSKKTVLVGEGKFRSSFEGEAIVEAYSDLKAKALKGPISMEFTAAILSRIGDERKAAKIMQLRRQIVSEDKNVTQKSLLFLGTVGQPRDPFKDLESLGGELLPNLIAVNVVFKAGLQDWLDQVYGQEYR